MTERRERNPDRKRGRETGKRNKNLDRKREGARKTIRGRGLSGESGNKKGELKRWIEKSKAEKKEAKEAIRSFKLTQSFSDTSGRHTRRET